MHIYAFGSVCRGEVFSDSDIDLLVITNSGQESFTHDAYSIYSYERIEEIWDDGNPFAWHLSLESRLIFSSDGNDFIKELKLPKKYTNYAADSEKFHTLLLDSSEQIRKGSNLIVFELSNLFLAIRNISICYSLSKLEKPVFSRSAAVLLKGNSVPIPMEVYLILERARVLCTRGIGDNITDDELSLVKFHLRDIIKWSLALQGKGELNV